MQSTYIDIDFRSTFRKGTFPHVSYNPKQEHDRSGQVSRWRRASQVASGKDIKSERTKEILCNHFRIRRHTTDRPDGLEETLDRDDWNTKFSTYDVELRDQDKRKKNYTEPRTINPSESTEREFFKRVAL